jgi:hypothetical protein
MGSNHSTGNGKREIFHAVYEKHLLRWPNAEWAPSPLPMTYFHFNHIGSHVHLMPMSVVELVHVGCPQFQHHSLIGFAALFLRRRRGALAQPS